MELIQKPLGPAGDTLNKDRKSLLFVLASLSRAGFALKFKTALGDTPLNYLTSIRIQQAMKILTLDDHKIESVALDVGYADAFSFSKAFKKRTGQSPIEFRKQARIDSQSVMKF